jgi:sterol desaturase/sphingolipid hydroxylase (fatty acid hydroxylase superfamily)
MPLDLYTQECLESAQGRVPRLPDGTRPKTIRVFKSSFLEFFGLAHPVTPILWWGPFVIYGLYAGFTRVGVWASLAWILAGLLAWTLLEYFLHRFVFHLRADTERQKMRRFMFHWYHHEFPNDSMRLVAPPLMSWSVGPVIWLVYRFAFGPVSVWPIFAGTAIGYLAYDYIHYYTHHFKPRSGIGKWLRSYHLLHHHDAEEARFGVSSPLWDIVFGTYRPVKSARASRASERPTVRDGVAS